MRQILALLCLIQPLLGLRFAHDPVTIDTDVLIVGKPSKLTCNFVKFRTEKVFKISWVAGYGGFKDQVFEYVVNTGAKKVNDQYSYIQIDSDAASETELTITLLEGRAKEFVVGCEVETLRDNGYGSKRTNKKYAETTIPLVDAHSQQLMLKPTNSADRTAAPGEEVVVQCISQGANPPPQLSLRIEGENVTDMEGGSVVEVKANEKEKIIEGRVVHMAERYFRGDELVIECLAHYGDMLFGKDSLALRKKSFAADPYFPGRGRPASVRPEIILPQASVGDERYGRTRGYDSNIVTDKLLELIDPARHVHPGIPYDFYIGYLLMIAEKIDDDSYGYAQTVTLLGPISQGLERSLNEFGYGRWNRISDEKTVIKMEVVQVLNLLGRMGYRVTGSSGNTDKFIWTLEQRDYEQFHGNEGGRREF